MAQYITPTMLIPLVVLALILTAFFYYWSVSARPRNMLEAARLPARRPMSFSHRHPMEKKDALPLILLTLVYTLTAFFRLGSASAPQSRLDLADGAAVEVVLDQPVALTGLSWFSGLGTGSYRVEASADGVRWSTLLYQGGGEGSEKVYSWSEPGAPGSGYAMTQAYNDLFKWRTITWEEPKTVRYLRLTGRPDSRSDLLEIAELALYSATGESRDPRGLLHLSLDTQLSRDGSDITGVRVSGPAPLFDEQDTVPLGQSTWYDSAYFDEIYHPRTALEHIRGIYPYEVSHPPLGKLILGLGIRAFGMTPFGWRCTGVLFGVLMLPFLYVLLKNLFGKTVVAACGTALFAFDFMHLVQTRLATIDTYGVFFILVMYFFLYRWLTLPAGTSFLRGMVPLFLSGLSWGLGIASKWTVIYGGVGLAVLYFVGLGFQLRDWPPAEGGARRNKGLWLVLTLLFSVVCFVAMPLVIYTASYLPYAQAAGVDLSLANTLSGLGKSLPVFLRDLGGYLSQGAAFKEKAEVIPTDSLSGIMLQNQWFMFTYHQGVSDFHPYSSRWYQWIVDARPILYYLDSTSAADWGGKAAFACFNNPVVAWAGLFAMITAMASLFWRRASRLVFFLVLGLASAGLCVRVGLREGDIFDPALPAAQLVPRYLLLALCVLLFLILAFRAAWNAPDRASGRALFLVVGYLSQLVPWMLIGRTTFEYHYFPSTLFLVLALCWVFNDLMERRPRQWKPVVYGLTGGAVGLYALFYPVLVGLTVPAAYSSGLLKWLPSWPL